MIKDNTDLNLQKESLSILIDLENLSLIQDLQDDKNIDITEERLSQKMKQVQQNADNIHIVKIYFEENTKSKNNIFKDLQNLRNVEEIKISFPVEQEWIKINPFPFILNQLNLKSLYLELSDSLDSNNQLLKELDQLSKQFPKMKQLQSIQLNLQYANYLNFSNFMMSIQNLTQLRNLSLKFQESNDGSIALDKLGEYLKLKSSNINKLEVCLEEQEKIDKLEMKQFLDSLQLNKTIIDLSLSVSDCSDLYKEFTQQLSQTLCKMDKLNKLNLKIANLNIKTEQIKQILLNVSSLKNLNSLEINVSSTLQSCKQDAKIYADLLKSQTNLTTLSLNLDNISLKKSFTLLSQELKQFTKLQNLSLYLQEVGIGAQKKGCEQFFDFLEHLPLTNLNLNMRQEEYCEEFLITLTKQIGKCSNLKCLQLQLGCYDLDDEILNKIVQNLLKCTILQSLTLCDALGLILSIPQFRQLKYLVELSLAYQ